MVAQVRGTHDAALPVGRRRGDRGVLAAGVAGWWSLVYGMLGTYWASGGAGFPFGNPVAGTPDWMSLIDGTPPAVGGRVIAGLGFAGAIVALALARGWGRGMARVALLGFAWAMAGALLLVIPDARVLALVGYLPALVFALGFDAVDWPMLNQAACVAGGFAWGLAALRYQRGTGVAGDAGPVRAAPAGPGGWGRRAAWAAILLPLPYAATRLAWAFGFPLGIADPAEAALATDPAARVNELSLGGMALGGALLTLGLVQRWGEVFPRWLPAIGGRRVPPLLAVVPAAGAAAILTAGGLAVWRMVLSEGLGAGGWIGALAGLAFLPWGAALGLATLAYRRRRGGGRAVAGCPPRQPHEVAGRNGCKR